MISARSWAVARRYAIPPLIVGVALGAVWRRAALIPLGCAGAVLLFFRDPERPLTPEQGLVYAAADGIVTHVERAHAPWLSVDEAIRISTFLSIHNVHVTRSPVPGKVVSQEHLDGRLRPALGAGVSDTNRQSRLVIDGPNGHIGVVLVAGAVARRITSWVRVGDEVGAGARLGLIHFGSRTDVLVPAAGIEPLVRAGARVTAGSTPIARMLGPTDG